MKKTSCAFIYVLSAAFFQNEARLSVTAKSNFTALLNNFCLSSSNFQAQRRFSLSLSIFLSACPRPAPTSRPRSVSREEGLQGLHQLCVRPRPPPGVPLLLPLHRLRAVLQSQPFPASSRRPYQPQQHEQQLLGGEPGSRRGHLGPAGGEPVFERWRGDQPRDQGRQPGMKNERETPDPVSPDRQDQGRNLFYPVGPYKLLWAAQN